MLSRYQLERTDLITTIEQGRRVELEQFRENHRGVQTMGELLKSRVFGSTEWAISLRKRMTYEVPNQLPGRGFHHFEPDPHPEHGVLCDCHDCDEAIKKLLRDIGILPRRASR